MKSTENRREGCCKWLGNNQYPPEYQTDEAERQHLNDGIELVVVAGVRRHIRKIMAKTGIPTAMHRSPMINLRFCKAKGS